MNDISNVLLGLDDLAPDLYPDRSIHSVEIEKNMPIWDEAGLKHFSRMIDNLIQVVFVCFVNRSGSNYLLDLLEQLDLGAKPTDEAFNYDQVIARCRQNDVTSFSSYFAKIVIANAKNGVCFLKIGGEQLFWLTKHGFLSRMMESAVPPKFIFMSRRDKVAQAVSLFIAESTGQFSESKVDALPPSSEPNVDYDAKKILDRLRYILHQEHLFSLFSALHEVELLSLSYEDLVGSPERTLREVLDYVDAPKDTLARLPKIERGGKSLKRQRGQLNRALIDQFRGEFGVSPERAEPPRAAAETNVTGQRQSRRAR
ncbi:MAG TPA: Stf0 family sulfotransferase [Xanthobacteraceae bacterium]